MAKTRSARKPPEPERPAVTADRAWRVAVVRLSEMEATLNELESAGYTIDNYEQVDAPQDILSSEVHYVVWAHLEPPGDPIEEDIDTEQEDETPVFIRPTAEADTK